MTRTVFRPTLDDLIEQLRELRRQYPGAATAIVVAFGVEEIAYEAGEIRFGRIDPDLTEVLEMEAQPRKRTPKREIH